MTVQNRRCGANQFGRLLPIGLLGRPPGSRIGVKNQSIASRSKRRILNSPKANPIFATVFLRAMEGCLTFKVWSADGHCRGIVNDEDAESRSGSKLSRSKSTAPGDSADRHCRRGGDLKHQKAEKEGGQFSHVGLVTDDREPAEIGFFTPQHATRALGC